MEHDTQRPGIAVVAALLRQVREDAALTQAELARRAGVSPSTISAYESGRYAPSIAAVDRLLATLGKQLRVLAEPLAADLDAHIDEVLATPLPERIERHARSLGALVDLLDGVPYVVEGALAGLLQGAPLPVETLEIVVTKPDLDALAVTLERIRARRWSNRWRQWGFEIPDPRVEGEPRWTTIYGELRLRVADERPPILELRVAHRQIAVRPLLDLELADPDLRRIVARVRQRLGSPV